MYLTEITCDIFVCVVGVWQHYFWTCGMCAWCVAPGTQVISIKYIQHSLRMDHKGSKMSEFLIVF